jgi:hypothetical protein
MTTETTTNPASSGLTAAEQAYFDSRGAKTDGLVPDAGAAAAETESKPDSKPAAEAPAKPDAAAKPDKPAAATAADPDEEPLGEDGRPKNPGRYVRHGAFHEERERRKTVERELQAEREARTKEQIERAKVAERLDLLNAALAPQPKAEDKPAPAPDPEQDIFGYAKWQGERLAALERQLGEVNGQVGKVREQSAQERSEAGLRQAYVTDAQRFSAATPDFGAAYVHLLQTRDQELAHIGHADPQKRAAMIAAEEREIVAAALQAGVSPSERIYGLAKLRGYAPAAVPAQATGGAAPAAGNGNGAASAAAGGNGAAANGGAAPTASAAAAPSVTDEIARIKAGTETSKSLSQAGGSPGGLTLEALASMSQDEFDGWMAKASKAQIRAVMGG